MQSILNMSAPRSGKLYKEKHPVRNAFFVTARRNRTMYFIPYNKHFSILCIHLFVPHFCRDEIAQSQILFAIMIISYLAAVKRCKYIICIIGIAGQLRLCKNISGVESGGRIFADHIGGFYIHALRHSICFDLYGFNLILRDFSSSANFLFQPHNRCCVACQSVYNGAIAKVIATARIMQTIPIWRNKKQAKDCKNPLPAAVYIFKAETGSCDPVSGCFLLRF